VTELLGLAGVRLLLGTRLRQLGAGQLGATQSFSDIGRTHRPAECQIKTRKMKQKRINQKKMEKP
jgi:hypothetical protein